MWSIVWELSCLLSCVCRAPGGCEAGFGRLRWRQSFRRGPVKHRAHFFPSPALVPFLFVSGEGLPDLPPTLFCQPGIVCGAGGGGVGSFGGFT